VSRHRVLAALLGMIALAAGSAGWLADFVRRGEIDVLFRQLESAEVAVLPELIPRLSAKDNTVARRSGLLFANGTPTQKLAAALVLAEIDSEHRTYSYDRLLDLDPRDVAPIARLLQGRFPDLVQRLEAYAASPCPAAAVDREAFDRRRATAACALILLDPARRGWSLLRFVPDPQARSFLIPLLGPAGVEPRQIVERLSNPATESSARAALIQSLDGIPDAAWADGLRNELGQRLLNIYRNDRDAGVHGSAKWLLRQWRYDADLERIDRALAGVLPSDRRFQWRISREGLTLITVDDPALDRVVEVSDSEITVSMYRRFSSNPIFSHSTSPDAACPINAVTYYDAAGFCNWLSDHEGLQPGESCYLATRIPERPYAASPVYRDRGGFRLPTNQEFDVICSAGTRTKRYCGDSDRLLPRYAWTLMNSGGRTHAVASLIPNDLGLFDTLGNLQEWCERMGAQVREDPRQAADLRGGWCSWSPPGEVSLALAVAKPAMNGQHPSQGFRVIRTKWVRRNPAAPGKSSP
jgi:hypothetical protein